MIVKVHHHLQAIAAHSKQAVVLVTVQGGFARLVCYTREPTHGVIFAKKQLSKLLIFTKNVLFVKELAVIDRLRPANHT